MATWIMGILATWLLLEGVATLVLRQLYRRTGIYYAPRDKPTLTAATRAFLTRLVAAGGQGEVLQLHPTLGWSLRPGAHTRDGKVVVGGQGARGGDYPPWPTSGKTRVVVVGDCLSFGEGHDDGSTWPHLMEGRQPGLEVINLGVDGYCPGQMWLRWRESVGTFSGQGVAILGLAASNLYKPLNVFRPFYAYDHGLQLAKPGFVIHGEELVLLPCPLSTPADYQHLLDHPTEALARLGQLDYYHRRTYSPHFLHVSPILRLLQVGVAEWRRRREARDWRGVYVEGSAALRTTGEVLKGFGQEAHQAGVVPVVVLMPQRGDLRVFMRSGVRVYQSLIDTLNRAGITTVDLLDPLRAAARVEGEAGLFERWHYSARGNAVIAQVVGACVAGLESGRRSDSRVGGSYLADVRAC